MTPENEIDDASNSAMRDMALKHLANEIGSCQYSLVAAECEADRVSKAGKSGPSADYWMAKVDRKRRDLAVIRHIRMAVDENGEPGDGWTCFHCGESFKSDHEGRKAARLHFGERPHQPAACLISEMDLRSLRYVEKRARSAREELARVRGYLRGQGLERAMQALERADGMLSDMML